MVRISVMKNLDGFLLFQKCKQFHNTLFYCIFQETKLESYKSIFAVKHQTLY